MKIAFDIDSTVVNSEPIFYDEIFKATGKMPLAKEQHSFDLLDWTNGDLDLLLKCIDNGEKRWKDFNAFDHAAETLMQIFKLTREKILFVTARSETNWRPTLKMLRKEFYGLPFEVVYSNDKRSVLQDRGINYFVEDRFKTCETCAPVLDLMFCINQHWNQGRNFVNKNIIRVDNIKDVFEIITNQTKIV